MLLYVRMDLLRKYTIHRSGGSEGHTDGLLRIDKFQEFLSQQEVLRKFPSLEWKFLPILFLRP